MHDIAMKRGLQYGPKVHGTCKNVCPSDAWRSKHKSPRNVLQVSRCMKLKNITLPLLAPQGQDGPERDNEKIQQE